MTRVDEGRRWRGISEALARKVAGFSVAAACALAGSNPALAVVYTVQQGDTIEVSVAGLPELRHRSNVQSDGAISLPLLGALKVEGMTPAELRLEVQNQLSGKVYRLHNNEGHEVLTVIEPDEVSTEIVAYRPIYVAGDVAHPGEQVFRPKMTVRQAVALAGGPGDARTYSQKYVRDAATVRSEYDLTRLDLARAIARIARLNAQLALSSEMPPVDLSALSLPKERAAEILQAEATILKTTVDDFRRERDFLKTAVAQTTDRIAVVDKQRIQEEDGSKADSVELQRMIDLLSHGESINPRVTDARRALLLSSTRALQINVELLELKRQQAEGERNIQRLEDTRRIGWLHELEDATSAKTVAAVKSHALEIELGDSTKARSVDPLAEPMRLSIEVVRQAGGRFVKSVVDDDYELVPGDTIEVTVIPPEQAAAATPSQ